MLKRTQCKNYSKESKKPMYKRAWLGALAIIIVAGTTGCSDVDNSKEVNSENTIVENKLEDTEYKSALEKAQSYCSDDMTISKAEVYNKLTSEYEGNFTVEAAQYAIDNLEVDWKENALKKAKSYLETMSMSKATLYEQLTSEYGNGFTAEEAQYAVDNVKADWKANAWEYAKFFYKDKSKTMDKIYRQLTSEYG